MNQTRLMNGRGSTGYMSRIYRTDLRLAVVFVAFLALIWSLIAGISSFRNVPYFNNNHESNLGVFYIVLGCLGMSIVAIEAFGIFAAASRRVVAVRIYAYLSILVTLLIAAIYIIQTIVHFSFKNDIINLCTNANTGDSIFFTGFFGPVNGGVIGPLEAKEWCSREFDRDSFSDIVALLVVTAVAALFALFVFAYLRQLSDPTSPANFSREPVHMNTFPPQPYNNQPYQPYNNQPNQPYEYPLNGPRVPSYPESIPPAYVSGDSKLGDGFGDRKDDQWS